MKALPCPSKQLSHISQYPSLDCCILLHGKTQSQRLHRCYKEQQQPTHCHTKSRHWIPGLDSALEFNRSIIAEKRTTSMISRVTIYALRTDTVKKASKSSPEFRDISSYNIQKIKGHRKLLWKLSLPGPCSFTEINGNYVRDHAGKQTTQSNSYSDRLQREVTKSRKHHIYSCVYSSVILCCPAETRTYVIPKTPLRYETIDLLYWSLHSYSFTFYQSLMV